MKRVLAISFLFVFLIAYITPITSVHATEVTWGDNNTSTISDSDYEMYKKVAVMSIIPDLLSTGVNELSIENASSVDDFVDNIIEYINNNAEDFVNLDTWSTLNELNQAINIKTQEIIDWSIENGWYTTNYDGTLNSIFDITNQYTYKTEYKPNPNLIPIFKRLSRLVSSNPSPTPNPNPDFSFISNINGLYIPNCNLMSFNGVFNQGGNYPNLQKPLNSVTLTANGFISNKNHLSEATGAITIYAINPICTINVTTSDSGVDVIYTSQTSDYLFLKNNNPSYQTNFRYIDNNQVYITSVMVNDSNTPKYIQSHFDGLSSCMNYIYDHYCNINLYVDGVAWALVDNDINTNINIDINGIELYGGTDKPVQYYYPNGTQIDYKKLYDVIKRAIDDSLSINNQTIWEGDTYYDSHDNVFTPTIYNYYTSENESEDDVLEDIINLAIVPKFDTALLQPIEEPITNGEIIMFLGVQSLPKDILFVIGAGFVLILFGAMINRLIE